MIELFRNGTEALGWIILGGAWAMQIGLLLIAVRGQKNWQWRLMFAFQILSCISAFVLSHCYNQTGPGYLLDFSHLDDTLNTLLAGILYCLTLIISWVFWVNRKEGRSEN